MASFGSWMSENDTQEGESYGWQNPGYTETQKDGMPFHCLAQKNSQDQKGNKDVASNDLNAKIFQLKDILN